MKYISTIVKKEFSSNRRGYLFLFGLIIIGIIFGSLFITILDKHDKLLVTNQITSFFNEIKSNNMNYILALKNSLVNNVLLVMGIWILGISIIGVPIIIFCLFFKGFIIGFSMVSIVYKYKYLGALLSFIYIFPNNIISIIILLILSRYACKLSFGLISAVIQKKNIDFKEIITKYFRLLLISIILIVISSLIEVFIIPYIFKLISPLL
jgi:stage II sporulation protein M